MDEIVLTDKVHKQGVCSAQALHDMATFYTTIPT